MRNRLIVLAAVMSVITVWLTPGVAQASLATSCSFDAGTATVAAVIGSGESATLTRNSSAIEFGGSACGAATVTNTDQINIDLPDQTTTESLTISMANGAFAPGKTAEGDGSDEIEIAITGLVSADEQLTFVGTGGDDTITVGYQGTDLLPGTADEQEVTYPAAANTKEVDAGAGNDTVWMDRAYSPIVNAGEGDDSIIAGCFADSKYDGGAGNDTMDFSRCDIPFGVTVHALGGGGATAQRDIGNGNPGSDDLSGIEEIIGSDANDTFYGSSGPDRFVGGAGNDWFLPWVGDDYVDGGIGLDTLTTGASTEPVTFDMSAQEISGEGADTFANVEILQGSPGNDRFTGDPRTSGVILVDGYGGGDVVDLRDAAQRQFVWTSPDSTNSAPPWVRLIAEDIRKVRGTELADRIVVGSLNGQELRARFRGEGGDDRLVGGMHRDVLDGGLGNDTINGAQGRDTCIGDAGDVVLNCEVLSR